MESSRWIVFLGVCGVLAACGDEPGEESSSGDPTSDTGSATGSATGGDASGTGGSVDDTAGTTADTADSGDTGDTTGGEPPPPSGMPAGIPFPSFGWQYDTDVTPTIYVDNTDPACDDAVGSAEAPLCDPFAGTNSLSLEAGDVMSILGGPYVINGDKSLTLAGTEEEPVIIRAAGDAKVLFDAQGNRADFSYDGQYAIVEGIDFFHMTRHLIVSEAHHLVFHRIEVHNPEGAFIDFNPVVAVGGDHILIYESMIYDNRRENDTDSHGINAGSGSSFLWILDNELYNNNGDSFQGCHECFAEPPHHVYIGRNVLHEDRENAVDLKTIHDVVVSENLMYGYGGSMTSSGDAMVIGSNGYVEATGQGPRRVWVLNNELRDSTTGIRIEGVEDAWIIGNVFESLETGLQIDDKEYRDLVITSNTMDGLEAGIYSWNSSCSADSVTVENNLIGNVSGHDIELPGCDNATLANNLLWESMSVRIGGQTFTDAGSLDVEAYASGHLDVDPGYEAGTLQPSAGSPAVDAGVSLEAYHAAVEAEYGGQARMDLTGSMRPAGAGPDIGAYER